MPDATYIHGTAPDEQARLAELNRLTNAAFLDFLTLRGDESVLEIGSGLGILAADAAARLPHGRVTGLEYSADQLARAPTGISNLSFFQGDAHRLAFGDQAFDVVYCRYLLEHVARPDHVAAEAPRVLKPGGRFYAQENDISLVRHDPPTPAFDLAWQRFGALQQQLGGDAYIGRRLFGLLSRAGFREITLSLAPEVYGHGHPRFAPWLENLVGNIRSGEAALHERGLASPAQTAAAVAELRALMHDPHASTIFCWNRAAARRPACGS